MTPWTDEISLELTAMIAKGITFAEAAAELSAKHHVKISRSSCIGKAHRLGIVSPYAANLIKKGPKPQRDKIIRIKRDKAKPVEHRPVYNVVQNGGGGYRIQESRASDLPNLRCVEIEPLHLTLMQLEPNSCRQPYDIEGEPTTYCGHPKWLKTRDDGTEVLLPYCRAHSAVNFLEPKPRKDTYVARKVSRFVAA